MAEQLAYTVFLYTNQDHGTFSAHRTYVEDISEGEDHVPYDTSYSEPLSRILMIIKVVVLIAKIVAQRAQPT